MMVPRAAALAFAVLILSGHAAAAETERVLLVVNDNSDLSRSIGEYYAQRRGIPAAHICHLKTSTAELIYRDLYDREIAKPIGDFLRQHKLQESIYYIVTTA